MLLMNHTLSIHSRLGLEELFTTKSGISTLEIYLIILTLRLVYAHNPPNPSFIAQCGNQERITGSVAPNHNYYHESRDAPNVGYVLEYVHWNAPLEAYIHDGSR